MKRIAIYILTVFVLIIQSCVTSKDKPLNENFNTQPLIEWSLVSSTQVSEQESIISSTNFNDEQWLNVEVPTTVLRALVNAGIYPDPHLDLNNFLIPDASDELNRQLDLGKFSHLKDHPNPFKDPYWFRTEFDIPKENGGKRTWINFDGINYRADVWLNGKKIADSKEMAGMFQRFKFDVTEYINAGSVNVLAVKIYQVDHPGTPVPGKQLEVFGPNRGQGKDIFKDVTLKFSAGWDCAPVVRDRNMGIYQNVYLTYTDAVDIIDPYVVTDLPLPDTTVVNLTISTELSNVGKTAKKGILKGSIDLIKEVDFYTYKKTMPGNMKTVYFEKEIEIPAEKTIVVSMNSEDFPQLSIKNPYLWWPNGYGEQYLHNLKLAFEIDGKTSDVENTTFGIREITNTFKEIDGEFGRVFHINGERIFCRGGWLQPDMMLDMNEKRMYDEARLLANANVNMIANEDMPSPPAHVMETYDKYGLLMWETFYQCWRMYPGTETFGNPVDTELALKNSFDIIKRYRSHPSLVLWAVACEVTVREELYTPLRNYVKEMDPTRPFLPTSSYGWDVDELTPYMKEDLPLGMTDEGAPDYTWYPHPYYYEKVLEVKQQMFRNEMGVPSVPTLSSMKKFIFDLGKGKKDDIYPLDKNWAHHGAWDDQGYVYRAYDEALRERYGFPSSAEDYIRKAQYVNAGSYRAMYEAANHRMWDITSGVMLWKLNSAWPTVVWQLYDWFLNPTSAYYFAKRALEPLHIQLNEHDFTVSVINTNHKEHKNLSVSVRVLDFDLNVKWEKEEKINIEEDRYKDIFQLPEIEGLTTTYFVKLELKDGDGRIVSDNFYWFSSENDVDLHDLSKLNKVDLDLSPVLTDEGDEYFMQVVVKNSSNDLAFLQRLMITKGKNGEEVLPTFWDDNFFSLLPGEEKVITARFAKVDLEGKEPVVVLDKNQY